MEEKCCCGLNLSDLSRGTPYRDLGFRNVKCGKCGKELLTDIQGKTCCFDYEK